VTAARPSVAAIIAAAACATARWRARALDERVDSSWHPGICRLCKLPYAEVVAMSRLVLSLSLAERRSWEDLGPTARLARIREAQELEWWEALDAPSP
jgi:hypothetical protein